jgi:hypothetical protein
MEWLLVYSEPDPGLIDDEKASELIVVRYNKDVGAKERGRRVERGGPDFFFQAVCVYPALRNLHILLP